MSDNKTLKLLIVDDDPIIRNGLGKAVKKYFPEVMVLHSAESGKDAIEKAEKNNPNIIITDINMPDLDGLDLIEKLSSNGYEGEFLIISGYSEFKYAKRALELGVKHYILKPCKDNNLIKELKEAIDDYYKRERITNHIKELEKDKLVLINQARQQLVRDLIFGEDFPLENSRLFKEYYGLWSEKVRLVIIQIEGRKEIQETLLLKKIIDETIGGNNNIISTILEDKVIFVTDIENEPMLKDLCRNITFLFNHFYPNSLQIAISRYREIVDLQVTYKNTLRYLNYQFFDEESKVATEDMMDEKVGNSIISIENIIEQMKHQIKFYEWDNLKKLMTKFFHAIRCSEIDEQDTKSYCYEVLLMIIRVLPSDDVHKTAQKIVLSNERESLSSYEKLLNRYIDKIIKKDKKESNDKVEKIITYINNNISSPALSVNKLATEVVFLRTDYLGKLFKKYTGKSITGYIRDKRIEMAKKMLLEDNLKTYEICRKIGFKDNVQYFCKVFKQCTGKSTTQFRNYYKSL